MCTGDDRKRKVDHRQAQILQHMCAGPGAGTCLEGDKLMLLPLFLFFFFFCLFAISWAAPAAYGGSQARGPIGAVATGLRQSHSNAGSEPHLQPTPQLTATPDP